MTGRWPIPESWQWVQARDVAEIIGGGTPSTRDPENFAEVGIPWLTPADLSGYEGIYIKRGKRDISEKGLIGSGARLLPAGTVLFTSRAPIGYCVIAENEISTNQGFKSLVLRDDMSPEFVRFYLKGSKEYAESLASGSTFKELSGQRTGDLAIPVPPLNEQRRIVAKIEELTARSRRAREALEVVPPLLEQLRQSVLAAAFSGRLTADWREKNKDVETASVLLERIRAERRRRWEENELAKLRAKGKEPKDDHWKAKYKEPDPVDPTGLPELPNGWCWCTWSDLSEWVTYGFTRPMPHVEEGIPIVTAKNVKNGRISFDEVHFTTSDAFESLSGKDRPHAGDILITKDGTIGRAAVVPDCPSFCINQSVAVVWLRACPVDRQYLLRVIEAPITQKPIEKRARGMALQHLSITDFAALPLPLAPGEEQIRLADRLDSWINVIDRLSMFVEEGVSQQEAMNQSILAKAFRGELVPQDPNDEPASVLLERIRAQRAATETNKKEKKSSRPSRLRGDQKTRKDAKTAKNPTDDLQTVLHYLQTNPGPRSKTEILNHTNLDPTTWPTLAPQLNNHPQIHRTGQKRGTAYRFFRGAKSTSNEPQARDPEDLFGET